MSMGSEAYDDMLCESAAYESFMEDLIERRTWPTKDGRQLKISNMETSHILNTIKWMERIGFSFCYEYKKLFLQELNRRDGGEGI